MKRALFVVACLMGLVLVGCGSGGGSAGSGDPAQVVTDYFTAKIAGDETAIRDLLCSEMESVLEREVHSFDSVSDASLENAACTFDEASSTVRCTGQISALYGTETTTFPLTNYRVVQEDGEWRWCGEAP